MKAVPVSGALGIELPEFDIARPCSPDEQAELRSLFREHHLILLRGQNMTDQDHDRFVKYFGPLSVMRTGEEAVVMTNDMTGTPGPSSARLLWHVDGVYGDCPNIATSLWAQDVAPGATGTGFLNAVRALETLPGHLRDRIEGLRALHVRDMTSNYANGSIRNEKIETDVEPWRYRTQENPIAYTPPHTDREVLLVCEQMTSQLVGLPKAEGDALLDALLDHLNSPENIYMHTWQTGDVIIWDNICLQHCRPGDVGTVTRKLRRLTIDGWNTGDGVIDWFATASMRDTKADEAYARMAAM